MTDNTELQRLIRLRRLDSQIAASLTSDRGKYFREATQECGVLSAMMEHAETQAIFNRLAPIAACS